MLEQKLDILFLRVWGVIYARTGQELDKAGLIWPTSMKKNARFWGVGKDGQFSKIGVCWGTTFKINDLMESDGHFCSSAVPRTAYFHAVLIFSNVKTVPSIQCQQYTIFSQLVFSFLHSQQWKIDVSRLQLSHLDIAIKMGQMNYTPKALVAPQCPRGRLKIQSSKVYSTHQTSWDESDCKTKRRTGFAEVWRTFSWRE